MSIIYDALQKTQKNREYLRIQSALTQKTVDRNLFKRTMAGLALLFVSVTIGGLGSYYILSPHAVVRAHPALRSEAAKVESSHLWVSEAKKPSPPPSSLEPIAAAIQVAVSNPPASPQPSAVRVLPEADPLLLAQNQDAAPSTPVQALGFSGSKLTLNGVMISDSEKVALINNQSFHLGDLIEGMKLIAIEFNKVKLQSGQEVIELNVAV